MIDSPPVRRSSEQSRRTAPATRREHGSAHRPNARARHGAGLTSTAAEALALQRDAGNRAVVALLVGARAVPRVPLSAVVQRQGAAPLTEGMTEADARYVADDVLKDYHAFYARLMQSNTIASFTHYRLGLMRELDAIGIDNAIDRGVFDTPLAHMDQITTISEKLADVKLKLHNQHQHARRLWVWLESEVPKERAALSAGSMTDQFALDLLAKSFETARTRVTGLGDLAVAEDFTHVVEMVQQKTHRKLAPDQAVREEQKLEADRQALSAELAALDADDAGGILSKAWSVVGWDSWSDFAQDLGLTVITFGYSKYARTAKRSKRAVDLAKKAKLARKLRYAKKLEKFKELADASERLVKAVHDHQAEITNVISWVKANAKSLARKIGTDLGSDVATGTAAGAANVAIDRVRKGYIQAQVDDLLNVSEEQGKKYVELATLAFAGGKRDSGQRMLRAFLSVSGRRRALTNVIDAAMRKLGKLDFPDNWARVGLDVATMANTTAFEVTQDLILGIPFVDKFKAQLEAPIEAVRKIVQKLVQGVIGG
jgi:hypothetical protein